MIVIKTEIGKALAKSAADEVARAESGLAAGIIGALLERIRARVEKDGDLAGQRFPGYSEHYYPHYVSPDYPDSTKSAAINKGSGARIYGFKTDPETGKRRPFSAAEYHELNRTKRGSYAPSGGMWAGLSRVISTPTLVHGQFRGRSPGQSPWAHSGRNRSARTTRINNALKVWTVLAKHNVNVLAFSDEELDAVRDGAIVTLGAAITKAWSVGWEGNLSIRSQFEGDGAILDIFRAKLQR